MENNNNNYRNAFLAVAHILAPTTTFDKVIETITYTNGECTEKTIIVRGYDVINNHNVIVTTEDNNGLQMVVKHLDDNDNVIYSFYCWYYSFNWQGLIESEKSKNNIRPN